jgi:hypothetical protein
MADHDVEYDDDNGEEDDFSTEDILRVLSLNSHRNTTRWACVNKNLFVNGRLVETHFYIEPQYDRPDAVFEENWRMTEFEGAAIAKAYIMAGIESELDEVRAGG